MKSFLVASIFVLSIAHVFGSPQITKEKILFKEEQAIKECNEQFPPAQGDPRTPIGMALFKGEIIKMGNSSQWCNLNCFLEKVGFFDSNGDLDAKQFFKFVIASFPDLSTSAHYVVAQLFQIKRSIKGVEDKCMKAFIAYQDAAKAVLTALIAIDLNRETDIRKVAIESVLDLKAPTPEFEQKLKDYLKRLDDGFLLLGNHAERQ